MSEKDKDTITVELTREQAEHLADGWDRDEVRANLRSAIAEYDAKKNPLRTPWAADHWGGEREWGRPETVGMMMICLGIVGMVFASFEFISRVRHLERREYAFMKGVPFAVIVAIVTAAIGVFALVAFFVQWLA